MKTLITVLVWSVLGVATLGASAYFATWLWLDHLRAWFNRPGVSLDELDQRSHTTAGRCPNCRRNVTGLAWVIVTEEFGGGLDRVCHGCSGLGLYKGWYRAQLPSPANVYDIAAAHEAGDLDDIDDLVRKWSAS